MCKFNLFGVFLAILALNENIHITEANRLIEIINNRRALVLENETITLVCRTEWKDSLGCAFLQPNFEVKEAEKEEDDIHHHWARSTVTRQIQNGIEITNKAPKPSLYSINVTAINRICSMSMRVTEQRSGKWYCVHGVQSKGVEKLKSVDLEIKKNATEISSIFAKRAKSLVLNCSATIAYVPLSSCRFKPPNEEFFSVDPSVTESNPISKRFYYPKGKSLARGDCSVTIKSVRHSDIGTWHCRVVVKDGDEYTDVIFFNIEPFSPTAIISMIIGIGGTTGAILLITYYAFRRNMCLGARLGRELQNLRELEQLPPIRPSNRPDVSVATQTLLSPAELSEPGPSSPLLSEPGPSSAFLSEPGPSTQLMSEPGPSSSTSGAGPSASSPSTSGAGPSVSSPMISEPEPSHLLSGSGSSSESSSTESSGSTAEMNNGF